MFQISKVSDKITSIIIYNKTITIPNSRCNYMMIIHQNHPYDQNQHHIFNFTLATMSYKFETFAKQKKNTTLIKCITLLDTTSTLSLWKLFTLHFVFKLNI